MLLCRSLGLPIPQTIEIHETNTFMGDLIPSVYTIKCQLDKILNDSMNSLKFYTKLCSFFKVYLLKRLS